MDIDKAALGKPVDLRERETVSGSGERVVSIWRASALAVGAISSRDGGRIQAHSVNSVGDNIFFHICYKKRTKWNILINVYWEWKIVQEHRRTVFEKTLESPLDSKEIKPVNPKGNQPWKFTGRTDAKAPIFWPPDMKSWLIGKDPDAGRDWGQEERGDRGWDGWMASPTQWTWVWANSGRWWRTWKPGVLQSMGSQRAGHDLATEQQSCFLCGIQIPGSAPSGDRRNCFMLGVGHVGRRGISDGLCWMLWDSFLPYIHLLVISALGVCRNVSPKNEE